MLKISFRLFTFAVIAALMTNSVTAADEAAQPASPGDMKIFEPYIGTFRSDTKLFDDSDIEYYFTVSYQWFDQARTIVKYTVAMEIPVQNRTIINSEGFYGYDPFNQNLYVFGAFTRGMTGWGTVGTFDHESGARETWAKSMSPEGVVTHVRDTFQHIDADHWSNKTFLRSGDEAEWKLVVEDAYSRVKEQSG